MNHGDIISQYSTFNFSNERCFDKSSLDHVAKTSTSKRLLCTISCTKEDSNYLYNSISLLLSGEQSQLLTELRIKVVGEMVKNKSVHDAGNLLKHGVDNFEEDMLDSMRDKTYSSLRHIHAMTNVVCCNIRSVYPQY